MLHRQKIRNGNNKAWKPILSTSRGILEMRVGLQWALKFPCALMTPLNAKDDKPLQCCKQCTRSSRSIFMRWCKVQRDMRRWVCTCAKEEVPKISVTLTSPGLWIAQISSLTSRSLIVQTSSRESFQLAWKHLVNSFSNYLYLYIRRGARVRGDCSKSHWETTEEDQKDEATRLLLFYQNWRHEKKNKNSTEGSWWTTHFAFLPVSHSAVMHLLHQSEATSQLIQL